MAKILKSYPVLMSKNVAESIDFYRKLGFTVTFKDDDSNPRYVGIERDSIGLHLQWHNQEDWTDEQDRPNYRFLVDDVDGLYAQFLINGTLNMRAPWETDWGTYEFHLQDPDRNGLQFYQNRDL